MGFEESVKRVLNYSFLGNQILKNAFQQIVAFLKSSDAYFICFSKPFVFFCVKMAVEVFLCFFNEERVFVENGQQYPVFL